MKLLILTQKVDADDDLLGFMHDWLLEFAKQCRQLTVICLEKGAVNLPANVKVLSLGKESGRSRWKYIFNFYRYIWQERNNYDRVLAHMNPVYVILGGLIWRTLNKKIALWYVHKKVYFSLKLAEKLADIIFTASPESFRLPSAKLKIVGHGIALSKFNKPAAVKNTTDFKIVYVGRISGIKNQKLLVEAMDILVNKNNIKNIKVDLVGGTVYEKDRAYQAKLTDLIKEYRLERYVKFVGSVPNKDIAGIYAKADLSVNLCPTGGVDKAVLESIAAGLPVIVLNKTFAGLLNDYKEFLILPDERATDLEQRIRRLLQLPQSEREIMVRNLKAKTEENYSLVGLVNRIIREFDNI